MKTLYKKIALATLMVTSSVWSQVYYLKANETVSELLYNRLKVSPIYRNGYLEKVLKYNNISREGSTALPQGTEIRLPHSEVVEEVQKPKEEEKNPEPEDLKTESQFLPILKSYYVEVAATLENFNGDIGLANINSTFLYPNFELGHIRTKGEYSQIFEVSLSYVVLSEDPYLAGKNKILNAGLNYQILKHQADWRYGLRLKYENTTLILDAESGENYKLENPLYFSFGPSFQWHRSKFFHEANLFYTPPSSNDLKFALGVEASSYYSIGDQRQVGILLGYSHYKIAEDPIQGTFLGGSFKWNF